MPNFGKRLCIEYFLIKWCLPGLQEILLKIKNFSSLINDPLHSLCSRVGDLRDKIEFN